MQWIQQFLEVFIVLRLTYTKRTVFTFFSKIYLILTSTSMGTVCAAGVCGETGEEASTDANAGEGCDTWPELCGTEACIVFTVT